MQFLPAAAVLALFAAAPAMAAPLTVDFETVTGYDSVAATYADQGVSFGGDALALPNADALGTYFSNAPSPLSAMFVFGTDSAMNVASGFAGLFSFWYSSTDAVSGGVNLWSGLNGTGALLASFDLLGNAQDGCSDTGWCNFDQLSGSFAGIAYSVTFADNSSVLYDDLAFNTVPEPASALLVSLGLAGLAAGARRRRK